MGNQGNIVLEDETGSKIFIYSHWSGSTMHLSLASALAKKWRWDDPQYLGRIIFDEIIGKACGTETGFGLSSSIGDGHIVATVLLESEEVSFKGKRYSYQEFIDHVGTK